MSNGGLNDNPAHWNSYHNPVQGSRMTFTEMSFEKLPAIKLQVNTTSQI